MNTLQNKTAVVILAAGKGTRLGCTDKPKVMLEVAGRPIVSYVFENVSGCGFVSEHIAMVIGFEGKKIQDYLGDAVSYAEQKELLGTAHAAYIGSTSLPKEIDTILVMGGDDAAFYTPETLREFIRNHIESKSTVSLLTAKIDKPDSFGRVIRDIQNNFVAVKEKEEVTEEEARISEVSTGTYCFDRAWFENAFNEMEKIEELGEFGLNTTVKMAVASGKKVQAIQLQNSFEWFGINTKEELEEAQKRILQK